MTWDNMQETRRLTWHDDDGRMLGSITNVAGVTTASEPGSDDSTGHAGQDGPGQHQEHMIGSSSMS